MRLLCGQCGRVHELDDALAGRSVRCSGCGNVIALPGPGGAEPAPNGRSAAETPAQEGFAEEARKCAGRKVSVTCPACGKTVSLSARLAGRKARCKACNEQVDIPFPDDVAAVTFPPLRRSANENETGLELLPAPGAVEEGSPATESQPVVVLEGEPVSAAAPGELAQRDDLAGAVSEYVAQLDAGYEADRGELVSAVTSYRRETHPPGQSELRAQQRDSRVRRRTYVLAAVAAVVVPLLAAVAVLSVLGSKGGDPNAGAVPPKNFVVAPPPVTTRHETAPTPPVARRAVEPASCEVLDTATSAFAADGYFPVGPQMLYAQLKVRIRAGEKPLSLRAGGEDFVLDAGGQRCPCLGEPVALADGLPVRSRQEQIRIDAGTAKEAVLLFEVPRDAPGGTLHVDGAGAAQATFEGACASLPAARLAGTYVETPPRNLRPLLRQPVMAAIQAAPEQKLLIEAEGNDLRIEIPAAAVRGTARQTAPGLYRAALHCSNSELASTLRFLAGGATLLLYLDETPFHQLTYTRAAGGKAAPSRPKTASPAPRKRPAQVRTGPSKKGAPAGPDLWPERSGAVRGYDPNAKPDPKEAKDLPRGRSWFD